MHCCVVINPKAGKQLFINLYLPLVLAVFDEHNITYDIVYTTARYSATEIAKKYHGLCDFFTILGGDGTIKEVVAGMMDDPIPIGIIPFGTVNVLAMDLGIPFDPIAAAHTIATGNIKKIDIGITNGEPFLLMTSIGIDADAVHHVNLNAKKIIGRLAYITSAIKSIFLYRPTRVSVKLLDKSIVDSGYVAIVSNSRFYGGKFTIDENTRIDDGLLNVTLFKRGSIIDTFRLFMGVLTKTQGNLKDIAFYQSSRLLISSKKKARVQIDGDIAGYPPLDISVKTEFLPVFIPDKKYVLPQYTRKYLKRFFKNLTKERKKQVKVEKI